jgi:hypothetical protein
VRLDEVGRLDRDRLGDDEHESIVNLWSGS